MFPVVIFTEFFLWSCTHGTVGLMQMRGVNQAKEKSESADSNQENPCIHCRSRRNRLGTRPGTLKKDLFECWKFYKLKRRNSTCFGKKDLFDLLFFFIFLFFLFLLFFWVKEFLLHSHPWPWVSLSAIVTLVLSLLTWNADVLFLTYCLIGAVKQFLFTSK